MIKSTKVTLKFSNTSKLKSITDFIEEYHRVTSQFVDLLWPLDKVPSLLPKELTSQISTWLSARAVQSAGKQASGVVRGTRQKQKQRIYVYEELLEKKKYKQARKLKKHIDKAKISKPNISRVEPELDERFVKQDWNNSTSFDGIITLSSLGNNLKIIIPVKKTKHFNKLLGRGKLKFGVRLSKRFITFNFEIEDPPKKEIGETHGLDIGITNVFTMSNHCCSQKNKHGHDLDSITNILSRKQKGSKAFKKTQEHRDNYINWAFNQIDFSNIKTLRVEDIKYLRFEKKTSRKLSHFTYTKIDEKISSLALDHGVLVEKVNPTYTSQRCSCCGWVRSKNRRGKEFRCVKCGFTCDADLNASFNILADLRPIGRSERLLHKNRKGFYWNEVGKEPIVPFAQKPDGNKIL